MKTIHDTLILLEKLDVQPADSLEDQDLDFKERDVMAVIFGENQELKSKWI